MQNLALKLNGLVMLGLLAGGAGMTAYVMATPELRATMTKPLPGYGYLDGTLTASLEGTYKKEIPVKNGSSELLNAFTVSVFGQGRKGVLIGKEGWLFSAEEYDWTAQSADNLSSNLSRIGEIADELRQRGIVLRIALIPEKADIYADRLTAPRPNVHGGQYEAVRQKLSVLTDSPVPDLRAAMLSERQAGEMFFPTDTHWTVAGSGTVAKLLATSFSTDDAPSVAFAVKSEAAVHHSGDLLRFVELGPFRDLIPPTADEVKPIVAVAEGGSVDDFLGGTGETAEPTLALVGTSYSANALWSFESQLKLALGQDIVNFAEEGHGPMVPMEAFMKKVEAGAVDVKAVFWEIPLRYLDDKPDVTPATSSSV